MVVLDIIGGTVSTFCETGVLTGSTGTIESWLVGVAGMGELEAATAGGSSGKEMTFVVSP